MKNLLLLFLIVSTAGYSQKLKVDEVDEFTGDTIKMTQTYILTPGQYQVDDLLYCSIKRKSDKYIPYAMYVNNTQSDLGCAGHNGYITFLFEDGSTLKLKDYSSIDCEDNPISVYFPSKDEVKTLTSKKVTKIRFSQSEYSKDYIYSEHSYTMKELFAITQ